MAENYAYFYNSKNGDRVYDADSMTDWLRPFFVTGVFNGELRVTANNNMTVTVAAGYCNIKGKVKNFINETTLDLETASGTLNRIDTVILRRNDTDRDIQIMVQTGGYSSSPTPPALVRTGAYYDLKLAEIYVAAGAVRITQAEITDTRADADVCGWVVSTVKEIDFSQITAQFNAYFATYQGKITAEFAAYAEYMASLEGQGLTAYEEMVSAFGDYETEQKDRFNGLYEDFDAYFKDYQGRVTTEFQNYLAYIGNLESQGATAYQSMVSAFETYKASQETRFNDLYEEMRELISEAAAAQLQIEIDEINAKIGSSLTDLATKLSFKNVSGWEIAGKKIEITNTDTGKKTLYAYEDGGLVYLTEHGNYTIYPQDTGLYSVPHTFTLDNTKTTETLSFKIFTSKISAHVGGFVGAYTMKEKAGQHDDIGAFVGGYVGAYVAKGN